jgi:LemA protein
MYEGGINMGKGLLSIVIGIVVVIGICLLLVVPKYNSLVNGEEAVDSKWAQVENQLQRRFDLIPNLVETVKGFAAQEKEILTEIADARTKYGAASNVEESAEAEAELSGALSRLLVIVENYPDLKSDANFRQLMDELAGTENRLAVAREDYNNQVQSFNSNVRKFPGNVIASVFGFEKREYFESDDRATEVPTVDFGGDD